MSARADKHQRILTELLTRPGNDVCADCKERAPRWASWNIGIFVCVHCASIHRKMGTHISKVKSVTLDTWSKDQVENMKSTGNIKANQTYNPDERRHPPPTDSDESDRGSEMEKFIRDKYQYKRFMAPSAPRPAPNPRSPSPTRAAPSPPAKDPVPGRVGGTSLGEASEFDRVIRAPSRAKSTPIVSTGSGSRTSVLSPPSPTISTTAAPLTPPRVPVFRPSTASAIGNPHASINHRSNTAPAPPFPLTPSPRPQTTQPPSSSTWDPSSAYASQSSRSYLPQSTVVSPPNSNPVWDDMLAISGSSAPASAVASPFNSYSPASSLSPYSNGLGGTSALQPRSMTLPSTTSVSPMTTGASSFSNTSSSSGNANPFNGLASGGTLGVGMGMTGPASNPFGGLTTQRTGYGMTGMPSINVGAANPVSSSSWMTATTAATQPGLQPDFNQAFSGLSLGANGAGSAGQGGASYGMNGGLYNSQIASSNSSPFASQASQQSGLGNPSFGSGVSFQQAFNMSPTPSSSMGTGSSFNTLSSFSSAPSSSTSASSFSAFSNQSSQSSQSQAPSQMAFAQSMLPAHLKQQNSGAGSNNPFAGAGTASGAGGATNPWGQSQQQQQQQQQQLQMQMQKQQAGQDAFSGLAGLSMGMGMGVGANGFNSNPYGSANGGYGGANGWR